MIIKARQVIPLALVVLFVHASVYADNGITIRVVEGELPQEMKAHIIRLPPPLQTPIKHTGQPGVKANRQQNESSAGADATPEQKGKPGNGEARQAAKTRQRAAQRRSTRAEEQLTRDHPIASDRPEVAEKPERPTKPERPARPERADRPEKPALPERPERPSKPERPGK